MSFILKDGGQAFPVNRGDGDDCCSSGMSLLDWFAGQALSAVAAHTVMVEESGVAQKCYAMAEAMLKARKEIK